MSPASLGLGMYPTAVPAATSAMSTSSAGGGGLVGGLNAAATELARLGDRAAAAAACVAGFTPWSLPAPPFTSSTAVTVDRPSLHDRAVMTDRKKNQLDNVNKQRSV